MTKSQTQPNAGWVNKLLLFSYIKFSLSIGIALITVCFVIWNAVNPGTRVRLVTKYEDSYYDPEGDYN